MTLICSLLLAAALSTGAQAPEQKPNTLSIAELSDFDVHSCTLAQVEWIDAMIVTRAAGGGSTLTAVDIENSIPSLSSYGCVSKTASAVVIIHSFSGGEPDDYLVVPKGWIRQITPLRLAPASTPEPEPGKTGITLTQK